VTSLRLHGHKHCGNTTIVVKRDAPVDNTGSYC